MSSSTRTHSATPACQRPIQVRLACTYCHDQLVAAEGEFCAGCLAPHHADCFREHGECSAPGCGARRTVGAPEPTRPARNPMRGQAFGQLYVLAALGIASLALPAVLWRNRTVTQRQLRELEARLAASSAANRRLEQQLAEARAKLEPGPSAVIGRIQGRPEIPIAWPWSTIFVEGEARPEHGPGALPGGAR